jgi:aminomethyltransferase
MVPFAGYAMPVQYGGPGGGVLNEHRWTRPRRAVRRQPHGPGAADRAGAAEAFEKLTPGDFVGLKQGKQR